MTMTTTPAATDHRHNQPRRHQHHKHCGQHGRCNVHGYGHDKNQCNFFWMYDYVRFNHYCQPRHHRAHDHACGRIQHTQQRNRHINTCALRLEPCFVRTRSRSRPKTKPETIKLLQFAHPFHSKSPEQMLCLRVCPKRWIVQNQQQTEHFYQQWPNKRCFRTQTPKHDKLYWKARFRHKLHEKTLRKNLLILAIFVLCFLASDDMTNLSAK